MDFELRIGKYIISLLDDEMFWMIRTDNGEGASFPQEKLAECLDKFYNDNF